MFITLALLSSVVWGLGDFLGGIATKRMHVVAVVGISQVFGLVAVLVWAGATGAAWDTSVLPIAVAAGLAGDIGLLAFYKALSIGRMGIVSPIATLGAVVPLAVGLAQGERPTVVQLLGVAIAVVGVVLASGPEISGGAGVKPVVLALIAAVGFGLALTFMAVGADKSVFTTAAGMRFASIAVLSLVTLLLKDVRKPGVHGWKILVVSGVCDVAANIMFGTAQLTGLLSLTAILGSLYPVVTSFLAWRFLHERLLRIQYLGAALAVIGVCAIAAG